MFIDFVDDASLSKGVNLQHKVFKGLNNFMDLKK